MEIIIIYIWPTMGLVGFTLLLYLQIRKLGQTRAISALIALSVVIFTILIICLNVYLANKYYVC